MNKSRLELYSNELKYKFITKLGTNINNLYMGIFEDYIEIELYTKHRLSLKELKELDDLINELNIKFNERFYLLSYVGKYEDYNSVVYDDLRTIKNSIIEELNINDINIEKMDMKISEYNYIIIYSSKRFSYEDMKKISKIINKFNSSNSNKYLFITRCK